MAGNPFRKGGQASGGNPFRKPSPSPEPEKIGVLEGLGASALGALSAVNTTIASTGRKFAQIPTDGRENPVSKFFREVEEGGRALAAPKDKRLQPTFALSEMVGRVPLEIGKYVAAGGPLPSALLGTAEAVGSTPEESEAGFAAQLAKATNNPRLASALESASQTAAGRGLVSTVMSAVPEVAIQGGKRILMARQAKPVGRAAASAPTEPPPLALPPGQYNQPGVAERLALPAGARPAQAIPERLALETGAFPQPAVASRLALPSQASTPLDRVPLTAPVTELPSSGATIIPPSQKITDPRRLLTAKSVEMDPATRAAKELSDAIDARRAAKARPTRRTAAEQAAIDAEKEARRIALMPEFEQALPEGATAEELAAYLAGKKVGKGAGAVKRGKLPERTGRASLEALSSLGGGAAGFVTGLATDEEGDALTPLQRALAYGAAGAGAGFGVARQATKAQGPFRQATALMNDPDPLLQKAGAAINVGKRAEAIEPSILTPAEKAYSRVVSETFPLLKAARLGGGKLKEGAMAEAIAKQQASGQAAREYLKDYVEPVIKGFNDDAMQRLSSLLVFKRDQNIRARGGAAKTALSDNEVAQVVAKLEADPKIAQAAEKMRQVSYDLLEKRYDAGLLSDDQFAAIRDSEDFYTPFLREMADDPTVTLTSAKGGKFTNKTSGVRRMDRTEEVIDQLADPMEVITKAILNTHRDVGKQRVNRVLLEMADADQLPFVTKVDLPPNAPVPKGAFQTLRNGKLTTYRVDDKDLLGVLEALPPKVDGPLMQLARAMKEVKTAGVTLLPDFSVANVVRDVALSGVQRPDVRRGLQESALGAAIGGTTGAIETDDPDKLVANFLRGAGLGAGVGLYSRPLVQTFSAMRSIVQNDDVYRNFLRQGGSTEGFFVKTPDDAQSVLKQLRKTGVDQKDILSPKSWVDALRYIGSVGEQSTRLAAYKQVLDQGGSAGDAIRAAQDRTLRFANVGSQTKGIAAMTPFWNAKVQGWDKLARLIKKPETYALGTAMLTAPSMALWSINKDNPEYWERPTWEKNLFWLVPKPEGSGFYRIPKPFEIGFLFASLPERMLDYAAMTGTEIPGIGQVKGAAPDVAEPGKIFGRAAADMAGSTMEGTLPIPEVISLPGQLMADKDLFRNRRIVSRPNLPTEMQATPESSSIARALSKVGVAPERTDFAIRNVLGTGGAEGSKLIDAGARAAGLDASAPTGQIPFVGRFESRFSTNDQGQTDLEAAARERIRRVNTVAAGLSELEKRGASDDEIMAYVRKNEAELSLEAELREVELALNQTQRARNEILRTEGLSADERKKALELIRADNADLARRALAITGGRE
jgi:hypothetical protein